MIQEIKFIESHSFIGEHFSMIVNEEKGWMVIPHEHLLEMDKNQSYEQHAVKLLKEIYDVDFNAEDVKFEWDYTL